MAEVDRACFECMYGSDEDVYVKPESSGVGHIFGGSGHVDVLELTDDSCEVCGDSPSLKKE